jgi:hypothetical protein
MQSIGGEKIIAAIFPPSRDQMQKITYSAFGFLE